MGELQILATGLSIVYILLAVKNLRICFLFGALSAIVWSYESFFHLQLKFDASLQIFYLGMSIYGWIIWKGQQDQAHTPIKKMTVIEHVSLISLGISFSIGIAFLGQYFFETNMPYLDAITSGFSIIATYLLAKRYIDNWIYWLVLDPMYMYIYGKSEAWIFVDMMGIYTIMSIAGLINWQKILEEQKRDLA